MVINGLDISLQLQEIYLRDLTQKLTMTNYFLIHEWNKQCFSFDLYTEGELRTIHSTFGHPNIGTTTRLMKRASQETLDKKTRDYIERILEDCII